MGSHELLSTNSAGFVPLVALCLIAWVIFREVQMQRLARSNRETQHCLKRIAFKINGFSRRMLGVERELQSLREAVRDYTDDLRVDRITDAIHQRGSGGTQIYNTNHDKKRTDFHIDGNVNQAGGAISNE